MATILLGAAGTAILLSHMAANRDGKRFENPHTYYVDLSQKLWDVKRGLLEAAKC